MASPDHVLDAPASTAHRSRWREAAFALATMALALAAAAVALRLWHADLAIPLEYHGDARYVGAIVDATLEDGWYLENDRLAAPLGQKLYDYPETSSAAPLLAAAILGLFTSDAPTAVNLLFLATFPLVALAAYLVLRRLQVSVPTAAAGGVLYALVPYHFHRGEAHLFLSWYFSVPVACYLVLELLAGDPLFARRRGDVHPLLRYASRRSLATVALCALVASTGVYYAGFTAVLLLLAAAVTAAAKRRWQPVADGVGAVGALALVVFLELLPSIVYRLRHGGTDAAVRKPEETELFSLKLSELVLPHPGHRLGFLGSVARRYRETTPLPTESGATLGAILAIAFLALVAIALVACASGGRVRPRHRLVLPAAVATLLAFVVATTGGLATVLAYTVTPQLRAWSRMSIFIAFFGLVASAIAFDGVRSRLRNAGRGWLALPLLASALGLGVLDQTSDGFIPRYAETAMQYSNDRRFVREIERRAPPGAAIFQLPYLPFPEEPDLVPPRMVIYDPLAGYLHSSRLRWSYGAIKGGPQDWAGALARRPLDHVLPSLAAAGFHGVEVDRFGYDDAGAALERDLQQALDVAPLTSPDGRRSFFSLARYLPRASAALPRSLLHSLRTATLEPLRITWGDDFWREERSGSSVLQWSRRADARLEIVNPAAVPQRGVLSATLVTAQPAPVTVTYPDGSSETVASGQRLRRELRLPPGRLAVRLATAAPSAAPAPGDTRRGLYVQVVDADLVPVPLVRAVERLARG